jgi:VanZ family protein
VALVGFGLWLASVGPARTWATRAGQRRDWIFGVAPSFLAAFTFVFWQAFATRSRPFVCALFAAALVGAAEVAQLFLPRYTADAWDVVAGVVGAAVAMPLLLWRERQRPAAGR